MKKELTKYGVQQDAFLQALGYMLRGFPFLNLHNEPIVAITYNFLKAQEKSRGTAESCGRTSQQLEQGRVATFPNQP